MRRRAFVATRTLDPDILSGDVERRSAQGWNEFLDWFVARIQARSATWAVGDAGRCETRNPSNAASMQSIGIREREGAMSKVTAEISMPLAGPCPRCL